jgi:hypothetical protein
MIELVHRFESEEYTCVPLYLSFIVSNARFVFHIPCTLLDSSDCPSAVITEGCMMNVALEPVTPSVYRKVKYIYV